MKHHLAYLLLSFFFSIPSAQEICNSLCQADFQRMLEFESATWVSQNVTTEEFYSTPSNATNSNPGDLLRWETVSRQIINTNNYSVPSGMSLFRFLYMSSDINNNPIPASAFALLPYTTPRANKPYDTVVWAHGTAGRIRNCAPSNNKNLYYGWQGPYALAQAGYAVIAPDYAGQGSDIPQGFMYESGYLHAADVAFGLIAARQAIGKLLSKEWVVIGHSEGGLTAWRTNERFGMKNQSALLKAGKLLGAVSEAPALRPLDLIPESIKKAAGGPVGDAVSVYLLQSISKLFPNDIKVEDYVTNTVLGRLALADTGCLQTGRALFANLTKDEMYKTMSWLEHPAVIGWQKRYNGAGPHALAAPMLITQGIADDLTYANNTELDFNRTCKAFPGSEVTLLLYPGVDHNVVPQVSQVEYMRWIRERFDFVKAPKGCKKQVVQPVGKDWRNQAIFYSGSGP